MAVMVDTVMVDTSVCHSDRPRASTGEVGGQTRLGIGVLHDVQLDESKTFMRAHGTRWLLLRPNQATLGRIGTLCTAIDLRDPEMTTTSLTVPAAGVVVLATPIESRLQDEA
jgi:hypothetical protein